MNKHNGIFITFEGGDGVGKSTHIKKLKEKFEAVGREVLIIREPGGTKIGEKIRTILLDNENSEMTSAAELLLYEASRSQIVEEKIKPALQEGKVVLCDRFFDSSVAYQGFARGLQVDFIKELNLFATGGLFPDKTIILFADTVENSIYQATKVSGADRIEQEGVEFQKKVWDGFLALAKNEPERFSIVTLKDSKEDTFCDILSELKDLI